MNFTIVNPKRSSHDGQVLSRILNYHAGFSNTFVREILTCGEIDDTAKVLDPWNGMGTTTYTASSLGFTAIGIDYNPVMRIISLANHASVEDVESIMMRIKAIRVIQLPKYGNQINNTDLLLTWFQEDTAKYIRYVDSFIVSKPYLTLNDKLSRITVREALFYVALFSVVKDFLTPFVGSNPTWMKQKGIQENQKLFVSNKELKERLYKFLCNKQESLQSLTKSSNVPPKLIYASVADMPLNNESIDLVITSPPYCTRIDYGVATLCELSVFFGYDSNEINKIRRELTGRTTIDKKLNISLSSLNIGFNGINFLKEVEQHDSYASRSYYFKNLYQYFHDMELSLKEISRVIKKDGMFICVVQDSFYKDVHCDLPEIIADMASISGFILMGKYDFDVTVNLANLNVQSKKYRSSTKAYESVLVFKKA